METSPLGEVQPTKSAASVRCWRVQGPLEDDLSSLILQYLKVFHENSVIFITPDNVSIDGKDQAVVKNNREWRGNRCFIRVRSRRRTDEVTRIFLGGGEGVLLFSTLLGWLLGVQGPCASNLRFEMDTRRSENIELHHCLFQIDWMTFKTQSIRYFFPIYTK